MSFRNRCVVAGAGGTVNLSIPLADGRNQRRPSKEVRIDNKTGWQGQHWKTITSCYNRSPWFEFYGFELEQLYQRRVEFLVDWNQLCWEWVVKKLELEIQVSYTGGVEESRRLGEIGILSGAEELEKMDVIGIPNGQGEVVDWRNKLLPRTIHQLFPEPIRYRQVFEDRTGFIPHCSILDLLFCEGKRAVEILKSSKIPS